jgi:hypothetical protein
LSTAEARWLRLEPFLAPARRIKQSGQLFYAQTNSSMETIMSTLVQAVLTAKVISIAPPTPRHDAASTGKKGGSSLLVPVLPRKNATQH